MKNILFILSAVALLTSCRSAKNIGTAIAKKDTVASPAPTVSAAEDSLRFINQTVNKLSANRIEFTTFSGKVNIDYRGSDGKNYDVNAVVRMYKDSAIWISANAVLGIEALRALITKDSVKLLDKLNKTYTARSVDYLQEVTQLPLSLSILQDLLIGNPVYVDSNIVSYARTENTTSLVSVGRWFKNLLSISNDNGTILRSKLDDADKTRNRTAELTYSDYENKRGPLFATKRTIAIAEKKTLDIKLDFKSYALNEEVSFPFSIPKNFKRN